MNLKSKDETIEEFRTELVDENLVFDNVIDATMAGQRDVIVQEGIEFLSPAFKNLFDYQDWEIENTPEA